MLGVHAGTPMRKSTDPQSRSKPSHGKGLPPHRSLAETFKDLNATAAGLSSADAAQRLRVQGPNLLKGKAGNHPLVILANQFRSPLVLILLAAAALSFGLGEADEAVIITLIVLGSSGLGFYQEFRASNTVAALQQRLAIKVRVLRNGKPVEVPSAEATIIVVIGKRLPTGLFLARDIRFAGLALRMERVELLVETLLGGFARVDAAANRFDAIRRSILRAEGIMHHAAPQDRRTAGHSSACR